MGLACGYYSTSFDEMSWPFVHCVDGWKPGAILAEQRIRLSQPRAFGHDAGRIAMRPSLEHQCALHPWQREHDQLSPD